MANLAHLVILPALLAVATAQTDLTLQPRTYGQEVVFAVNTKIRTSSLFVDDNRFLLRMAYVETYYGTDSKTYYNATSGGIWQVPSFVYNATKEISCTTDCIVNKIQQSFNITWMDTTIEDLHKPMYSGLAIRIFLSTLGRNIPDTIATQADFWKEHLNKDGSVEVFKQRITDLEKETICDAKMNLVIVLDASGSIQPVDFEIAKTFVANLTSRFDLENVDIGFLIYAATTQIIFPINNTFDQDFMSGLILNTTRQSVGSATNTHLGIRLANGMLNDHTEANSTIPRVLTVFTDGESTNPLQTIAAANETKLAGIISFAVGIGSGAGIAELVVIAGDDPNRVISSSSFDALAELPYRLNEETCTVPQEPPTNGSISDSVKANETRYFAYEVTAEGITLRINVTTGNASAFYSFTIQTPSSAIHDGEIKGEVFISYPDSVSSRQNATAPKLYVGIKGLEDSNSFALDSTPGDDRQEATTIVQETTTIVQETTTNSAKGVLIVSSFSTLLLIFISTLKVFT